MEILKNWWLGGLVCGLSLSCAHRSGNAEVEELKKQISDLQKVVTQHSAQLEVLMDKNPHKEAPSSSQAQMKSQDISHTKSPSLQSPVKDESPAEDIMTDSEPSSAKHAEAPQGLTLSKPTEKSVVDGWPEQKLFQTAYALQDSNPHESAKLFARFIRNFPQSVLADNSLYWLGMIQYRSGAYHKAILFWDKILRDYPQSNKVPEALYQMSQGYEKLNQPDKAKLALDRLTSEHGESESAQTILKARVP